MDPCCISRSDGGTLPVMKLNSASSTRTMGLESLLPELFEHLTDYLRIEDVMNLQLTSKMVSAYTRNDWAGFLRRRLVRHSDRNTRVLSFLVLLNSLYEDYLDKGKATRNDVFSAVSRLREGLAVDSGWGHSDRIRLRSLKRAENLQVMCYYMETIDHLTDDFASQLLSPISTRQKVLVARFYGRRIWPGDCPRWPTPESPIVLSSVERARLREGFLAHQVLCLLSKEDFHPHGYSFTGQLSPLEIERMGAIHNYLYSTWIWILTDGFERWCKIRGPFLGDIGRYFWDELADAFASGGIATLGRELDPTRTSWTQFDYDDDGRNQLREESQPDFDASAPPGPKYKPYGNSRYIMNALDVFPLWLFDDYDTFNMRRLSPGEEERQDSQITPLWLPFKKQVKTRRISTWGDISNADQVFRMIKPDDPSLSHDGYFNCRARGWVFLNHDTFETVQAYWNKWIRYEEGRSVSNLFRLCGGKNDWDLSYLRDFTESLDGLF